MDIQNLLGEKKDQISSGCGFTEAFLCHYVGQWKEKQAAVIHLQRHRLTVHLYLFAYNVFVCFKKCSNY